MPASPVALKESRSADSSLKKRGLDIGKQAGQCGTETVQHKVRRWQELSGGVAQTKNDVRGGETSDVESETRKQRPQSGEKKDRDIAVATQQRTPTKSPRPSQPRASSTRPSRGVDTDRKAWVRRKSRSNNADLDPDLKHAGAPKKRVISDGHWRKDRDLPNENSGGTPPEKHYTIKRSVVHEGRKSPRVEDGDNGIKTRPSRTKVNEQPRPASRDGPQRRPPTRERDKDAVAGGKDPVTPERPRSRHGRSMQYFSGSEKEYRTSPKELSSLVGSSDKHGRGSGMPQRPKHARDEPLSRSPKKSPPDERRSHKENHAPLSTPPKVFGNRIEAWLTETPNLLTELNDSREPQDDDFVAHDSPSAGMEDLRSRKISGKRSRTLGEMPPVSHERPCEETIAVTAPLVVPEEVDVPEPLFSKRSSHANARRSFPSTGKRLSTIVSVNTMTTGNKSPALSEVSDQATVVPESLDIESRLEQGLTNHDDLMSVLSLPRASSKCKVSARTSRTGRNRTEMSTNEDLWNNLSSDEFKYQRELRTLVDGVIPVLLSCVLSKSDAAVAAGLFGRSATAGQVAITQPIVDMGIALERLKSHHKRIPQGDLPALVTWATGAARIYTDYLRAWRMGFQDVVVNLAPAKDSPPNNWDEDLPRNADGDLVDSDGERVDVAYLLKRPLVRLKYLSKTFKGFNTLMPSTQNQAIAERYQQLVTDARKRSNEERARIEDEAAATIDPTRARDLHNLAPLAGVSIDATRCVAARDYFDMDLQHSSGQQLTCKIELVMREDAPNRGHSGDVLVCEITDTGRWLLFPPIRHDLISARSGTKSGEVVVMIRGFQSDGQPWQELLSLTANEEQAAPEWVQMLGMEPLPPVLSRTLSFAAPFEKSNDTEAGPAMSQAPAMANFQASTSPPPPGVEVPIGEQASAVSKRWSSSDHSVASLGSPRPSTTNMNNAKKPLDLSSLSLDEILDTVDSHLPESPSSPSLRRSKARRYRNSPVSPEPVPSQGGAEMPQYFYEDMSKQQRPVSHRTESNSTSTTGTSTSTQRKKSYSVWLPSSTLPSDESDEDDEDEYHPKPMTPPHRSDHARASSVPSLDQPSTPKLRKLSPLGAQKSPGVESQHLRTTDELQLPSSAPAKLQKKQRTDSTGHSLNASQDQPQNSPPPKQHKRFSIPSLTPAFLRRNRRPSSPLKHEYEPSSPASSSESSYSDDSDDESLTSESSEDHVTETQSSKAPDFVQADQFEKPTPPDSVASLPPNTVSPSQSASQAPYRSVPQQPGTASRSIGSIFSWCDHGAWEKLHPHECSIVVTPGLIEVFELNVHLTHNAAGELESPSTCGIQPLVAFEVTPLVPLRRGTALDISIRSPPTANSIIRSSNNVMVRSRNSEECEVLYAAINNARINNPTYVALQNARGPFSEGTWAAAMERRNSGRQSSNSWWRPLSRKSSTYRSKGSRAPSLAATESSVGTMNSAFSALRRFSGTNNFFNIARSTIASREGSRSTNSDSLSSGESTPLPFDPSQGTPLGIANTKIRLHLRETATKWRDMGSARLTVMLPPRSSPNMPASPRTTGMEKRVLITGKTHGEVLLDVTLPESCFERVARTGIAISVWEENRGPNGEIGHVHAVGGVGSSRAKTYMIQMKSERDCAYTFGLVGKLRY